MTAEFLDSDPMLRENFESELQRATAMVSQGNARYWLAYCRGLRRRFGGPEKVSEGEHQRWLRLHPALHSDELAGYGDALRLTTRIGPETVTAGGTCEALRMTVEQPVDPDQPVSPARLRQVTHESSPRRL